MTEKNKVICTEYNDKKIFRSENYNYNFDKRTGYFERWGQTQDQDPQRSFFGPEIADIEITTICHGPAGKLCSFCSPAGVLVNTPAGMIDIKDIKIGDEVWSATSINNKKIRPRINKVAEKYERLYTGKIYNIELEDGTILKVTDEHPIMVKGIGEVMAKDLKLEHEIYHVSDFKRCIYCNDLIDSKKRVGWSNVCSLECKESHSKNICLICNKPFYGKKRNSKYCCTNYPKNSSKHRLRQVHIFMIERCYNPKNNSYSHYGELGIKVDEAWLDFATFLSDMESTYFPGYELDRIDNTKNYCKENCRWVSKREQRQNRSQPKHSKHPYKGVVMHKNKWKCTAPHLTKLGKGQYLGLFNSQKEAINAYNDQIKKIYPDNFNMYIQEYKGEL